MGSQVVGLSSLRLVATTTWHPNAVSSCFTTGALPTSGTVNRKHTQNGRPLLMPISRRGSYVSTSRLTEQVSSCVPRQGESDHSVQAETIALSMTRSFLMQAVMTTLKGLPAALRRSPKARMTGLYLRAVRVAM